jgi:putative FmdB family regulatory protein
MPTYDYRCKACGHEFEQFQSMKDAPLRKCPACKKASLERLIGTGAAILFKGSGFYETDYRSESYKKAAEADKPQEKAVDKPAEKSAPASGDASSKPVAKESAARIEPKPKASSKAAPSKGSKRKS